MLYFLQINNGGWHVSGEGPWGSLTLAIDFGHAEVGMSWRVTDGDGNILYPV